MRSFFSWLMTFVFAFEPFLQTVHAADKATSDQMAEIIKASSLGVKGKTYADLYMFVKMNMPPRFADRFAQLMLNKRNEPLPDVEFSKFKTKEGHEGLKLVISGQGATHTLEILNEDAMFAKLDGVPLTIQDIDAISPAVGKIVARNPNLYRKISNTGILKKNPTVVFNPNALNSVVGGNFLVPTKENWERLTPTERARFIIEIRKTWKASLEVENIIPGPKAFAPKKTASLLHPYFLNALGFEEAFAAAPAKPANECATPVPPAGERCIHSGYIGLITMNGGTLNCTHPNDLKPEQKSKYPDIANQKIASCPTPGQKACNPALYGAFRGREKNRTICVDVNASSNPKIGQDVTHWEGRCEVLSPLDATEEAKLKGKAGMDPELAKIEIDPGDVTPEVKNQVRKLMENKKVALDNAAAQLASTLNYSATEIRNSHFAIDAPNSELKRGIFSAIEVFYSDINSKLAVCKAMYATGQKAVIDRNPKNPNCDFSKQLGACQQLVRRKLVMDALAAEICPMQVYQIGNPDPDDPKKTPKITTVINDAKLDTIAPGSFDPAKACMLGADGPPADPPPKKAPAAAVIVAPVKNVVCTLSVVSKKFTIRAKGPDCFCDSKEDPKVSYNAFYDPGTNDPQTYHCPEEEQKDEINPWIPVGIVGAGLLIYALNRDKTKPRLGECPANTTRVGESCFFTPICDKVRYPEVTMVNNQCVLPGNCPVGAAKDANGKCLYPADCPSGSTRDTATGKCLLPGVCPVGSKADATGKCVVDCPANTRPLPNNTCQWGVACPFLNNQIVYDLAQCKEGGGTTTPTPGAGGVQ